MIQTFVPSTPARISLNRFQPSTQLNQRVATQNTQDSHQPPSVSLHFGAVAISENLNKINLSNQTVPGDIVGNIGKIDLNKVTVQGSVQGNIGNVTLVNNTQVMGSVKNGSGKIDLQKAIVIGGGRNNLWKDFHHPKCDWRESEIQ